MFKDNAYIINHSYKYMFKTIRNLCLLIMLFSAACSNEPAKQDEGTLKNAEVKKPAEPKTILFFGNSLTAGYGLEQPEDAFPSLIQKKIDSLKLPYRVVNAGLSGETTSGGNSRVDWILRQPVDIFVLELGANDGLRGIQVSETAQNLQSIIDKVKGKYPNARIILAGMEVPPNMGNRYVTEFRSVFRKIAEKNNIPFIPFLLEGVGGVPELNLQDGIHPSTEGHRIVAENVWTVLKTVL
jgi:acyl-CoA thioesterase-1